MVDDQLSDDLICKVLVFHLGGEVVRWRWDPRRCTWVGEENYLNIGLIGGGCSAKSNSISCGVNNKTKGGGPRNNSTTFPNFNITTCRHGIGHLNIIVFTTEQILGGFCAR